MSSLPTSVLSARLSEFEELEMARSARLQDESQFEIGLAIALPAIIGAAAFMFGSAEAWSSNYLTMAITVLWAGLCVDRLLAKGQRTLFFHASFLPPILFTLLALFQLIPLPGSVLNIVSPGTAATYTQNLASSSSGMSISLAPEQTRAQIGLLIAGIVVFLFSAQLFRTARLFRITCTALAVVVVAVAATQVGMILLGSGRLAFVGPASTAGGRGGPFEHYNHFSFFINVGVLLVCGLIVSQLVNQLHGRSLTLRRLLELHDQNRARAVLFLTAVICLGVASVFLSGSRTGILSAVAGLAVLLLLMWRMPAIPGGGWLLTPAMLVGGVAVITMGLNIAFERFGNADDGNFASRVTVWRDVVGVIKDYPVMGIGLGAHLAVFPLFDTSNVNALSASHVENQYLQLIEEAGLVGGALALWFIVALLVAIVRRVSNTRSSDGILIVGPVAALAAILLHSVSDFATHLPANTIMVGLVCGAIIAIHRWPRGGQPAPALVWNPRTHALAATIAIAPLLALAALVVPANFARATAENARWQGLKFTQQLSASNWDGNVETYRRALVSFAAEVRANPRDIDAVYRLNLVRWQLLLRQDASGNPPVFTDVGRADARRILGEIQAARTTAPTFALAARLEAEILLALDDAGPVKSAPTQQALRRSYRLNPTDAWSCRQIIELDLTQADAAEIEKLSRHYVALNGDFPELARLLMRDSRYATLVENLATGSFSRLEQISDLYAAQGNTERASLAREQAIATLERELNDSNSSASSSGSAWLALARSWARKGETDTAISLYRKALYVEGASPEIRLELARVMASGGRFADAQRELELCIQVRPTWTEARDLLGEIAVKASGKNSGRPPTR